MGINNYPNSSYSYSFDDAAEEKCKENLDAAVETNPSNPEAHQLMASFWLSKGDKEVSFYFYFQALER